MNAQQQVKQIDYNELMGEDKTSDVEEIPSDLQSQFQEEFNEALGSLEKTMAFLRKWGRYFQVEREQPVMCEPRPKETE